MDRFCSILENEKMAVSNSVAGTNCTIDIYPAFDEDGNKVKPTIIEAEIVGFDETSTLENAEEYLYNNVNVKQGDLAIFHNDSAGDNVAKLIRNGELEITTQDDDSNKYSKQDTDLIYAE